VSSDIHELVAGHLKTFLLAECLGILVEILAGVKRQICLLDFPPWLRMWLFAQYKDIVARWGGGRGGGGELLKALEAGLLHCHSVEYDGQ